MTQIYLEKQAFVVANELRKQGYDVGELVSKLLVDFYQNSEKETPIEACAFCTHRYYSRENLEGHIARVHKDKTQVSK